MIKLGRNPTEVPVPQFGPQVPAGHVFVAKGDQGAAKSELEDGVKAVLEFKNGYRELTTSASVGGIDKEGTYLSEADLAALGAVSGKTTLRTYGVLDTVKKAFSKKGVVLLLSTGLGLLLAVLGLYFAVWAESGTSAAAVAERGEVLIGWVAAPASFATSESKTAAAAVQRREALAQRCLTALRGGEAKLDKLAGVKCEASSPSFWKDKDSAGIVAAVIGVLTTLLGLIAVGTKFKFGEQPS